MSALEGRLVAVSVSDAPDRARLGLPQREVDRALLAICTTLVRAGADVAYSGNLDPDGYTYKIFRHLAGAYATTRDTPFHHFIPESVARFTRYEDLLAILQAGRGVAHTEIARGGTYLRARAVAGGIRLGESVVSDDVQLAGWFKAEPAPDRAAALSKARNMVAQRSDARVILGGKMGILDQPKDQFEGAIPGIAEEAILALDAGKPLVVLGAFGGVARDAAIQLDLLPHTSRVPRGPQQPSYAAAMEELARRRDRLPKALRPLLKTAAEDDRTEQTARRVVEIIRQWLALIASVR